MILRGFLFASLRAFRFDPYQDTYPRVIGDSAEK